MSDHASHTMERHCDVAVIGGSVSGLAAAVQLGRQRRSVIVVDAGEPRHAPAAHMHGYLGYEAQAPSELTSVGRAEVHSYGGEVLAGRALDVSRNHDGALRVHLAGGHALVARRVLAATGLVDDLPLIEGLAENWGGDVIHCPFCHGYEFRDRRIVQIVDHAMGLHTTPLWRQLTAHLTVVLSADLKADAVAADSAELDALRAAGVGVVSAPVSRIVTGSDGHVSAIELTGHEPMAADAVALGPRFRARTEPFISLGLRTVSHPSGLGDFVETNATGETAVSGLYAAGNVTDPSQQLSAAAADGSRVGAMIAFSLAGEDLKAASRASAHQADWDHRYGGEQLWSGNPNGTLVNEVSVLPPGRALDVGAGEGGDAMWLAEQAWSVTATDISARALARIGAEAERRGLLVTCLHADANAFEPFEPGAFDLVSAQYASIPRTPDGRGVHNLLQAVAPGGSLLVVSHDLEAMRAALDTRPHSQLFDPDAFVRVEDFRAVLTDSSGWEIQAHDKRARPAGAAASSHHVDDVVLRARRL